jgi:ligand-binding sensor domain-containing protein/signal transduction histidine kinase
MPLKAPRCPHLACFVFAAAALFCAAAEIPDVSSEYQLQAWGQNQGFPDSWVWSILQTRDGYLWAATRGGLVRYDGESFKVYDRANTPTLTTDEITALAEDTDGSLWIGTADGLLRFQHQRFTRFELKDLSSSHRLICLASGRRQAVWAGMHHGVVGIDRVSGLRSPYTGSVSNMFVCALQADDRGTLWAGTESGLLRLSESDGKTIGELQSPAKGFDRVRTLALDPNGALWGLFADGKENFGVFRREKTGAWIRPLDSDFKGGSRDVTSFLRADGQANWWFPTKDNRIVRFNGRQLAAIPVRLNDPADLILSGWIDREGGLWYGTKFSGLGYLCPRLVQTISTESGLPDASTRVVLPARDGSVWVGTDSGVSRYANGACVNYSKSDGLSRNDVTALAEDATGAIWVGTGNGLDSIKDGKITRHRFNGRTTEGDHDGVGWNKVRAILAARDGSLWVGIARGLHRLVNGQDQFFTTNQLSNRDVHGLIEDRAGDIWITTDGGGVNRWHQGEFTVLAVTNGLSSNHAGAMLEDREGAIWIAAEGGLNCWRDGRFTVFTTREGLFENQINQILEDDLGHLWLGGDQGLYSAPLADFDAVAAGRMKNLHPRHYAESDGMLSSITSGGKGQLAGCKTSDGRLWFPTARGIAVVNPRADAFAHSSPPLVVIQRVLAGNRIIYGDDAEQPPGEPPSAAAPLRVAPGAGNLLEVRFSANTFVDPSKVRYKYRMEGLAEEWTDAGARRVANFAGLPPGQYRFHVIAGNHNNIWNDTGASLDLYLAPLYYQTWWFRIGCFLAFLGAAGFVYRSRIGELRQRNELERLAALESQRNRIGRDIHDDLSLNLTRIAKLSEGAEDEPGWVNGRAGEIAAIANQTIQQVRDIAWANNSVFDTLDNLVFYLREQAASRLDVGGIRVALEFPENPPARPVSGVFRHHLLLLLKEALNNVLKHSGATEVRVRLVLRRDALEMIVSDNGRGLPVGGESTGGNGLRNMRYRVEELGGRFTLRSEPGEGTAIETRVPLSTPEPGPERR